MSMMPRMGGVTVAVLLLFCVGRLHADQPSVTLGSSVIKGVTVQVGDAEVDRYLGIRFAKPPTGNLRFAKPETATLDAVVNATSHGSPCIQASTTPGMSEDCLFLDVYVPRNSGGRGRLLPVMMFIYGGAFTGGFNAMYRGDVLAVEGNVIFVIPNYRVGPFGFLSTGDNSSPGNFGLWDQLLALQWVRDNIDKFGGDMNNIALIGESAGAASVSHLMTSPHSRSLFKRAILQSGCRLCHWAHNASYAPLTKANELAAIVGCSNATADDAGSSARLVTCLRGKTAYEILSSYGKGLVSWAPVIDGDFVLPFSAAPRFAGSLMAGVNNREGGYSLRARKRIIPINNRAYYNVFLKTMLTDLFYDDVAASADSFDWQNVTEAINRMYKVDGVSNSSYVPDEELEAVLGDTDFLVCVKQLLGSNPNQGDTYFYYFDHYPETPNGKKGMDHAMDLEYTFGFRKGMPYGFFDSFNITNKDLDLGTQFRSILTNFAKTGNPYKPTSLPKKWPSWPPYKNGKESYLSVNFSPAKCDHLRKNRMSFWLETMPALLQGQYPVPFNTTRFHHCEPAATEAAAFVEVTKTVLVICLVFLFSLY